MAQTGGWWSSRAHWYLEPCQIVHLKLPTREDLLVSVKTYNAGSTLAMIIHKKHQLHQHPISHLESSTQPSAWPQWRCLTFHSSPASSGKQSTIKKQPVVRPALFGHWLVSSQLQACHLVNTIWIKWCNQAEKLQRETWYMVRQPWHAGQQQIFSSGKVSSPGNNSEFMTFSWIACKTVCFASEHFSTWVGGYRICVALVA